MSVLQFLSSRHMIAPGTAASQIQIVGGLQKRSGGVSLQRFGSLVLSLEMRTVRCKCCAVAAAASRMFPNNNNS